MKVRFCPPCKIILDCGGVLAAALLLLASRVVRIARRPGAPFSPDEAEDIADAARYYAFVSGKAQEALIRAYDQGAMDPETLDEAHAWAELSCHRAAAFRNAAWSTDYAGIDISADQLMRWAEEHRLRVTAMIGGEYSGAWTVDGIDTITKKEEGS